MLRSSIRLLYIRRTSPLLRSLSSSSSLSSKRLDSAKPIFNSHRTFCLPPISTTGAKLSRSEHSMAASSEPKSLYDFTVKVRFKWSFSLILLRFDYVWFSEFNLWLFRKFEFVDRIWDLVLIDLLDQDAKGNDVDLSIYKGKVLLIVNVASQW